MNRIYQCSRCGVITKTPEELCHAERLENMGVYCDTSGDTEKMCDQMKEHIAFVCGRCGRPAEQEDMVCTPRHIG